jgi:hypothetical protein
MNVSPLIKTLLQPLNMSVEPDKYTGAATKYIVWNYLDERPAFSADDMATEEATYVRVTFFTKENPEEIKAEIKRLLREGGFYVYSVGQIYENDTGYRHITIDAWID